jgi:hypothetical protein
VQILTVRQRKYFCRATRGFRGVVGTADSEHTTFLLSAFKHVDCRHYGIAHKVHVDNLLFWEFSLKYEHYDRVALIVKYAQSNLYLMAKWIRLDISWRNLTVLYSLTSYKRSVVYLTSKALPNLYAEYSVLNFECE